MPVARAESMPALAARICASAAAKSGRSRFAAAISSATLPSNSPSGVVSEGGAMAVTWSAGRPIAFARLPCALFASPSARMRVSVAWERPSVPATCLPGWRLRPGSGRWRPSGSPGWRVRSPWQPRPELARHTTGSSSAQWRGRRTAASHPGGICRCHDLSRILERCGTTAEIVEQITERERRRRLAISKVASDGPPCSG